jgi:hypothetical protein
MKWQDGKLVTSGANQKNGGMEISTQFFPSIFIYHLPLYLNMKAPVAQNTLIELPVE